MQCSVELPIWESGESNKRTESCRVGFSFPFLDYRCMRKNSEIWLFPNSRLTASLLDSALAHGIFRRNIVFVIKKTVFPMNILTGILLLDNCRLNNLPPTGYPVECMLFVWRLFSVVPCSYKSNKSQSFLPKFLPGTTAGFPSAAQG